MKFGHRLPFATALPTSEVRTRKSTRLMQRTVMRDGRRSLAARFIPRSTPPSISYISGAAMAKFTV